MPMSAADRAKQFAPFSPLNGLHKALAEKEVQRVPRKIIPEDKAAEINEALLELQAGQTVTVVYYNAVERQYLQLTGKFQKINLKVKRLLLEGKEIGINDIIEIL